jgi:hypothetical protein
LIFALVIPVLACLDFLIYCYGIARSYVPAAKRGIFSLASARFRTEVAFKHSTRNRSLNFPRHRSPMLFSCLSLSIGNGADRRHRLGSQITKSPPNSFVVKRESTISLSGSPVRSS